MIDSTAKTCSGHYQQKRIFWLSFLNLGSSNVVSQTELSNHLSNLGFDVYLFAVGSNKGTLHDHQRVHLVLVPLKFVPMITPLLYILALLTLLPFYVIAKKPDYLVTEKGTAIAGFVWRVFFSRLGMKTILDVRSTPLTNVEREHVNAFIFNVTVYLAKKFDGMTVLTRLMKDEICHRFNLHPSFVGVWTSGVSTKLFDPEEYNGDDMRKKLGLMGKFIVFYHGVFSAGRGLAETIEAINILKSRSYDVTFFLLGSGAYEASLRKLSQEIGVQENVVIHKKVGYTEVPKYIAMCDLGIVPLPDSSNWRNQCPLKLLEYLAMKKTVIVTKIPAHKEIMRGCKCGIYISTTDPEEIAGAIAHACKNKEHLIEWGSCGREIVKDKFDWEKISEDFADYLSKI